ncbi:FecR family protein [Dyadobacter sp. CY343]|uniref:FecR family protein n=1 Tax=Dyadobacter sp. CY343 TaxID=2907299 RepID=UPI001F235EE2|nr:FecR family protein [Dyadobacter sp. CY343]MCE7060321.1 FecR domain-containing protein [Dyadobacter sp. CY343]
METSSSRLALLFSRYYSGLATDPETNELMHLIRMSENDETLAALIRNAWESLHPDEKEFSEEESGKMLHSILQTAENQHEEEEEQEKVRPMRWLRYAAASLLIIAGFSLYWLKNRPEKAPEVAVTGRQVTDIPPGGNRAMLSLSDGRQIPLDSAANGLLGSHGAANFTKTDDGKLRVAVSENLQETNNQSNRLSTPKGGQYQVTLHDGSKVWLNASSSIRFPTVFANNNRTVEISGEAYFEVTKDRKRPFRVRFGTSEVEVLGTSFNIMAYKDESALKTTLVEGSVKLRNKKGSKKLTPGQQATISANGAIQTAAVDIDREIAWKNGLFYFKDSGIEEIMRQAARWYDIDVNYEGKIPKRQFTGKVSRNVNISELLNMLRYAGVNARVEQNKVVVKM